MWSSLEKFAYPDWFWPLVVEKPCLTFGLPRDAFIPMPGVAEFTLGFGLQSTALIRCLSAVALLVIFNAAVYPFGRIDLIGQGLIMAALVAIVVHDWKPARSEQPERLLAIPTVSQAALILFASLYWGSHGLIYSPSSAVLAGQHSTHSPDPDHPHAEMAGSLGAQSDDTRITLLKP